MHMIGEKQPINLKVVRFELDFTTLANVKPISERKPKKIVIPKVNMKKQSPIPPPPPLISTTQKKDVKELVEKLLDELYADQRDWGNQSATDGSRGSVSAASMISCQSNCDDRPEAIERNYLEALNTEDLWEQKIELEERLQDSGERLAKYVRVRDRLRRQQKRLCAAFTVLLRHITGESGARFGVTPAGGEGPGEGGYAEWLHAMRLVARLPAGVPQHFRRKLWITLANRHLTARGIDWTLAERACFRGTAQPDDTELGAQILKDLHRTGCSLFCGTEGRENQAMLRRVLLAYARWNKDVGYCQGFNMLAAIILEVMDKSESDSLKVMIYLVEAVLPEGYFADDLRGLSADMAAFRDLLRLRLPRLAQHMDNLQRISDGGGVEPPLPDVFTMQWFLTLYATWLPREFLLRIWDLVLLDGNEVLLLTALAIWDLLQDRILSARSADEFYSCMGGGAGAVWEGGDSLVARVVAFGSVPELPRLRSLHRYRVAPPAPPTSAPIYHPPLHTTMQSMTKRGLRLFYSEDEGDSSDDGNKMALTSVLPRREDRLAAGDRLSLDIGALKRQYARLRERQRQAHVILAAACARHAAVGVPTSPTSLTVNNLLLGKSALVSSRGRRLGPPPGAVPPSRQTSIVENQETRPHTQVNETISWTEEKNRKSLSRRNSVKWKDIKKDKSKQRERRASIDLDETGDGTIVSELEAKEITASVRSRSSSESSSYSSHSASSTDTSLCDERGSGSDLELPVDDKEKKNFNNKNNFLQSSSVLEATKICSSPNKEITTGNTLESEVETKITEKPIIADITDYLDSAAGEPLRTYIDGFESKISDSVIDSNETTYTSTAIAPTCTTHLTADRNEVIQKQSSTTYEETSRIRDIIRPTSFTKSPKNITDLSPIDLSPYNYSLDHLSPCAFDSNYDTNYKRLNITEPIYRPPDIIDSFTMYPNFVPDIDLSDKNISDIESPSRSPGAESIIVSEDEPPIPLKIDKYFEHSPEFFGARVTDPNSVDIPNRRAIKRVSRIPKKPDSLTLQSNHNDIILKEETERASSLPQNHSFTKNNDNVDNMDNKDLLITPKQITPDFMKDFSPKDIVVQTSRKNSEKALQIIQENSKILSRILTKQHISDLNSSQTKQKVTKSDENVLEKQRSRYTKTIPEIPDDGTLIDSPLLKESNSDSLIGYRKRHSTQSADDNNDFLRIRPISIDDPYSLEVHTINRKEEFSLKNTKSPSSECLGNKTDLYGWENKGFLTKKLLGTSEKFDYDSQSKPIGLSSNTDISKNELQTVKTPDWTFMRHSFSGESKPSVTLPSSETKETSVHEQRFTSDDYDFPLSRKYNDFVISKASDICSKTVNKGPKICENITKTDNSQVSDFSHVVTSSISFTYEASIEEDSPTGAKSNSSDTLCQITSLDQVSTPISPKMFPNRETPTLPKDVDKSDKTIVDSDDTCSAITSLIETDTLSSLSCPRSPSTGSYHPFPTRPVLRMPKELGVRLGMYPKDVMSSPQK